MACPKKTKTKTNINTKTFGDWIKFQTFGKKFRLSEKKRFWETNQILGKKLYFRKTNLIFGND